MIVNLLKIIDKIFRFSYFFILWLNLIEFGWIWLNLSKLYYFMVWKILVLDLVYKILLNFVEN